MKRILVLTSIFSIIALSGFAQKVTFKLTNAEDTTAFLIKYYGKTLRYADTAEIKNGTISFDAKNKVQGIYKLYYKGKVYPDVIINGKDVVCTADANDPEKSFTIKSSDENKVLSEYMKFMTTNRKEANTYRSQLKTEKDETKKEELEKKIQEISDRVLVKQKELIKENEGKFVAKLITSTLESELPEVPATVPDSLHANWKYRYFRDHYFDNIDLKDDRLINAPIVENKLQYFLDTYKRFGSDSLIEFLKPVLGRLNEEGDMFRFFIHHITSWSEKSKTMGMDKVFLYMGQTYYCPDSDGKSKAFWMPEENMEKMCDKVGKLERVVIGRKAINLTLPDSTEQKWHQLYGMDNEYTILYFWDPNCGHCKKTTPKLEKLYKEKFKERNIGIYAVAKATGDDFEDWKEFIIKHDLTFLNVGLTKNVFNKAMEDPTAYAHVTDSESLNYARTYDVYSTPRVFVLDKDKKILAKQLSIAQLEDYLDHLQGKSDAPKIFKLEDETPEDKPEH